jgi:PAS domain S-box-containing protein
LAVVPAFALTIYTGVRDHQRQLAEVAEDSVRLARIVANDQERIIDGTRQILSDLAGVAEVRTGDPSKSRTFFALLMKQYRGYASFSVMAPDGRVLVSLPAADEPMNFSDRPWFQRALSTRDFSVGEYQVGQLTGKRVLVAAWPAADDSGRVVSIITAALDITWLNQIAATAQLPPGAVLVLVDRQGVVVARHPDLPGTLGRGLPDSALMARLAAQDEGTIDLTGADGMPRTYAFTPIRGRVDTGLRLAIGIPHDIAYGAIDRLQRRHLMGLVMVMVLTLVASWFGAERFVLRRVSVLLDATRKLAAGDRAARTAQPYSHSELGDLARAFDDMAGALEARQAERDRAENSLRESEARFRGFMDNSPVIAFVRDDAGGIVYANATLERYFGLQPGEWRGWVADRFWSPESAARFHAEALRVVSTGEMQQSVDDVVLSDGRRRYWLAVTFPLVDGQGRGLLGTMSLDLTEWREIQEALGRSERRYTQLVEQATDAIVMTDERYRFVAVNSATCRLTGYSREELLQRSIIDMLDPAELASTPLRLDELRQGQDVVSERRLRGKDGRVLYTEVSVRKLEGGGIQAVVRDVGGRRAAELALRESEERFRLLYQYLPLAYQSLGEDGTLVLVNDAWTALTGFRREDACGRQFVDMLVSESRGVFRDQFLRDIQSGEAHNLEVTLACPGDRQVTVSVDARLGRDAQGRLRTHCILHDVTAAHEAEARIRESEERYRTLFDDSPVSLWEEDFSGIKRHIERLGALGVADLDEHLRTHPEELADCVESVRVVDVNRATLALYGAENKSQVLAGLDRIVGQDGHDVFRRSIVALANGERSWASQGVNYTLDGDPISVALEWSLAPGAETTWSRVLVSATDVTERTRAEAALRESEARFERVFRSAPEIMGISTRSDGRCFDVNDAFVRELGYSREEAVGRTFEELNLWVAPVTRDGMLRLLDEHGVLHNLEVRLRRRSGAYLDAMLSIVPLSMGGEDCLLVHGVDVTAWRRAEQELRESQRVLATLMSNLPGMAYQCCLDPEWTMLLVSEGCRELTGYEPSDLVGNHTVSYGSLIHEDDREMVETGVRQAVAEGRPFRLTYRLITAGGKTRWVWEQGRAAQSSDSEAITLEGFIADVTDRKRAEDELHESAEQLRQAQKMEAVGRLAGGIAHDFNNLLTAILGYSDLILNRLAPDDPMAARVEEIRRAGERAASLTRKLLAFGRKQVLAPKVLALDAVLEELAPMLRRLIGEDLELRVVTGGAGNVKVDPTQMEQVVMNLIVNARDAMPRGGTVTIETASADLSAQDVQDRPGVEPGPFATFSMTDTGIGMDATTAARLFEPFFTTKGQGKGTGLGLSTVYGIVQQSGGFVTVHTALGSGTTFRIWLPRVDDAASEAPAARTLVETVSGTETILVVEDEEAVRRLIRATLERLGYSVVEATDGEAALQVWEEQGARVHLVITDVVMPHMDGPAFVERIRQSRPDIPVLYLSGYADDALLRRGGMAPGTPFLQKPFSSAALARLVRKVLDRARA